MGFDNLATRCLSSRGNSFHVFPMVKVRQNLRRKLPYDFEDPVHAYPEVPACQCLWVCRLFYVNQSESRYVSITCIYACYHLKCVIHNLPRSISANELPLLGCHA